MASGPEMLLKALGINPQEMVRAFQEFERVARSVNDKLVSLDARLDRIENKLGIPVLKPMAEIMPPERKVG